MIRLRSKTAAALAGLGLLCGCANTNTAGNCCGEQRQGFFSRMFAGWNQPRTTPCECIETGRVSVGEGPFVPEPGCCANQGFPVTTPQGFPEATPFVPGSTAPFVPPYVPPMPPPTAQPLPGSNPLAQPVPANPSSSVKTAIK